MNYDENKKPENKDTRKPENPADPDLTLMNKHEYIERYYNPEKEEENFVAGLIRRKPR